MRTLVMAAALLSFATLFARADERKPSDTGDHAKLMGRWELVSGLNEDKKIPEDKLKGSLMKVEKEHIYLLDRDNNKLWAMTYTLDTSKQPFQITMVSEAGDTKGKTAEGIYAIEGDNLRLCYSLPGQKRPVTFDPKDSEGHQNSFVLKRMKEKKE
jgi:uncharacterized protein (TIGR03067 family)